MTSGVDERLADDAGVDEHDVRRRARASGREERVLVPFVSSVPTRTTVGKAQAVRSRVTGEEGCAFGSNRLGLIVGEPAQVGDDRAVERARIRPVDLDEVAAGIAQVHLHLAARQLADGSERVRVADPELREPDVERLEVVHLQAEVVESRRLLLAPLEEVELPVAEPEPDDGIPEGGRRQALETEELLVEARRLLEVPGRDADMIESRRAH